MAALRRAAEHSRDNRAGERIGFAIQCAAGLICLLFHAEGRVLQFALDRRTRVSEKRSPLLERRATLFVHLPIHLGSRRVQLLRVFSRCSRSASRGGLRKFPSASDGLGPRLNDPKNWLEYECVQEEHACQQKANDPEDGDIRNHSASLRKKLKATKQLFIPREPRPPL